MRQLLAGRPGLRTRSLCSSRGKSTHILSIIGPNDILLSNEVIRSRASILAENVANRGYPNVVVSNNDPADFSSLDAFLILSWWMLPVRERECSARTLIL